MPQKYIIFQLQLFPIPSLVIEVIINNDFDLALSFIGV